MKLILKDKNEITISNMSNRQYLLQSASGQTQKQIITFSIFNAGQDVVFDDILNMIKNGNTTEFELVYGENQKSTYPGWEISDIAEEITDEKRTISILATKIEAE